MADRQAKTQIQSHEDADTERQSDSWRESVQLPPCRKDTLCSPPQPLWRGRGEGEREREDSERQWRQRVRERGKGRGRGRGRAKGQTRTQRTGRGIATEWWEEAERNQLWPGKLFFREGGSKGLGRKRKSCRGSRVQGDLDVSFHTLYLGTGKCNFKSKSTWEGGREERSLTEEHEEPEKCVY
eukprot:1555154-Rhodomonas_salina.1